MTLEVITRMPEGTLEPTPLLFVHGILHGAWCFDEFMLPYFAEHGYIASALSLRGHAGSPIAGSLRWASIHDYVEDVATVAQQIEAEHGKRPVIIGHSMGGLITQKYLEKYDAPGGVLLAACPTHGAYQAFFRVLFHDPVGVLKVNLRLNLRPLIEPSPRWAFFHENMNESDVQRYQDQMGDESYRAFLDMMLFALPRPARIKVPMLVMGGEADTLFSVNEIRKTARAYNAPCEIIPDMAHDMMLEAGWRDVADKIISWITEKVH